MKKIKKAETFNFAVMRMYGKKKGSVKTADGYLSDCKPIVVGGKAVWYVTDGKNITFYKVDSSGKLTKKKSSLYLKTPAIKRISNTTKGISLKWAKVSGASGYEIYRENADGIGYKRVKKITKGSQTSWTDKNVKSGKGYNYKIRAIGKNKNSLFCADDVYVYYVKKPTLSSAKNTSKGAIKIKWKKLKNIDEYEIQYATNKKFTYATTLTVKKSKTMKTIKHLRKGQTYYVRLRACKDVLYDTYGPWSNVKKVKIKK